MSKSSYDIDRVSPGQVYNTFDDISWRDIQERLVHLEKILSGKLNTYNIKDGSITVVCSAYNASTLMTADGTYVAATATFSADYAGQIFMLSKGEFVGASGDGEMEATLKLDGEIVDYTNVDIRDGGGIAGSNRCWTATYIAPIAAGTHSIGLDLKTGWGTTYNCYSRRNRLISICILK